MQLHEVTDVLWEDIKLNLNIMRSLCVQIVKEKVEADTQ